MASYRYRRRRKDKDSKPKTKSQASRKNDAEELAAEPTTSVHDVPDHLLELILLRLRSSACLLRAAAACKRWRRVIAGAEDFLSRCLHARSCVAGHYHAFDPDWIADYGSPPVTGNPVFVPSTPSSLAVVDRRRFSLEDDLLPASDSGWALFDSHGSLLLLSKRRTGWAARANKHIFPDVVVCEPLTRRCQGILRPEPEEEHATCLGVFLLDGGGSSACLLRAAAACKRWRRVIAGAEDFLSRCLHARSCVAGHYHAFDPDWIADYGSPPVTGNPVFVPSTPSSLAVVDRRRFSLEDDLLPASDSGWALFDSHGSLLLLSKRRTGWAARANKHIFPDVVVCEPLTRRCQGILRPEPEEEHATCLGVFLLDGGGRSRIIGMSDFRLVAVLHEDHVSEEGRAMPVACVFSLGSDGAGWSVLPNDSAAVSLPWVIERTSFAGRANGSLYWVIEEDDGRAMLVFDEAAMEFSRVPLLVPAANEGDDSNDHFDRWSFRVIGGEDDGALRVVRLVRNELTVLARRQQGSEGDEWIVEGLLRLREATLGLPGRDESFFQRNAMVVAAHEEYLVVTPQEKTWLFSVDLKTMEVERDHERNRYAGPAFPSELPWPPSFMACATRQRGRRKGSFR